MIHTDAATWTPALRALWGRIERHEFEPPQALNFTHRLARDRFWPLRYARAAVAEYRRFCFLAVTAPSPMTPSEEVDEVWHVHLTYSRDYWDVWCGRVLQAPLHHDPTQGGPAEQRRFRAQYALTLARYESFFGPPEAQFWPATHRRFRPLPRFRTIDADHAWVLTRPRALLRRARTE
ncbi:MAG TPA: hypothetical protein VJY39_11995 [Acidisphaera sp.]|nr:hypothetical protein [Acidisphaera sp.]